MATAVGTGYDYTVSQYSPDGKLFQIEYAQKAVNNSNTVVGICFKNGVVLAVEKEVMSKLYVKDSSNRIFHIDKSIGMLVVFARKECKSHLALYGVSMPLSRVALMVHAYTLQSNARPFGCRYFHSLIFIILLASYENSTPLLYCINPSGEHHKYFACSIGKDKLKADTLLEKVKRDSILMDEGVVIAAQILHQVIDEPKPQDVEFELSFAGEFTLGEHQRVPQLLHDRAVLEALVYPGDDNKR